MATPISRTVQHVGSLLQPQLDYPKRVPIRGSSNGWNVCVKSCMVKVHGYSSRSAPTKLLPENVAGSGFFRRTVGTRRRFTVSAATIDDLEAEKSAIKKDVKSRMEKTIESVKSNFNSIRTGRANPAMLDKIEVEYHGTPVNLKSIAQISTPDASSFLILPFDKSSLKTIEKAIVSSNLGMTPNNDGEVIRMSVPQLTADRRKELAKIVAKQAEEGKVAVRNIRRDALKAYEKLKKEKKLSEDILKDLSGELQKLTDEYVKMIDTVCKQKEKEVLQV